MFDRGPSYDWLNWTTMTDQWSGFVLKYSHPSQSKQNYDYSILRCCIWCVLQTTLSDFTSRWLMWFVASWVRRWSEAGASYEIDGGGVSALRGKLMAMVVMKRPFLENKYFLENVFLLNFTLFVNPPPFWHSFNHMNVKSTLWNQLEMGGRRMRGAASCPRRKLQHLDGNSFSPRLFGPCREVALT